MRVYLHVVFSFILEIADSDLVRTGMYSISLKLPNRRVKLLKILNLVWYGGGGYTCTSGDEA